MAGLTVQSALTNTIVVVMFLSYANLSIAWLLSRRSSAHSSSFLTTTDNGKALPHFSRAQYNFTNNGTHESKETTQPTVGQLTGKSNWFNKWPWPDTNKPTNTENKTKTEENDSSQTPAPDSNVTATATTTNTNTVQNFTTLNITDPEMKKCFKSNGQYKVSAKEGLIFMVHKLEKFLFNRGYLTCQVQVTVSRDRLLVIETAFKIDTGCGFPAQFLIFDTVTQQPIARANCGVHVPDAFSQSNSLTIQVKLPLMITANEHRIAFRFKELAAAQKPDMELHYLTPTSGETLPFPSRLRDIVGRLIYPSLSARNPC